MPWLSRNGLDDPELGHAGADDFQIGCIEGVRFVRIDLAGGPAFDFLHRLAYARGDSLIDPEVIVLGVLEPDHGRHEIEENLQLRLVPTQGLLRLLALGDVALDADKAERLRGVPANWRDGEFIPEGPCRPCDSSRISPSSGSPASSAVRIFKMVSGSESGPCEEGAIAVQDFSLGVAGELGEAVVGVDDVAVFVGDENASRYRIQGGFAEPQFFRGGFALLAQASSPPDSMLYGGAEAGEPVFQQIVGRAVLAKAGSGGLSPMVPEMRMKRNVEAALLQELQRAEWVGLGYLPVGEDEIEIEA